MVNKQDSPKFTVDRFDRATKVDQIVASLKWKGGVVVKSFLNPTEVAEYDAIATTLLSKTQFQNDWGTTKRVTRLPLHMPSLVERVLSDELMLQVCDEMLTVKHTSWFGERTFNVEDKPVVQMTTAFAIAPGTGAQDLHRDDGLYHNRNPAIHPSEYETGRDKAISFFIAGRRTTRENGATNFIPGSHLQDTMTARKMEDAISAEMEAGDAFFMCASAYHGGGCNSTTDQWRLVYGIFMMQPILRQVRLSVLAL